MVSGRTSGTSAGSRKNRATPGSSAFTPARTDENMPASKPGLATVAAPARAATAATSSP